LFGNGVGNKNISQVHIAFLIVTREGYKKQVIGIFTHFMNGCKRQFGTVVLAVRYA
jgi:hypothetical protein